MVYNVHTNFLSLSLLFIPLFMFPYLFIINCKTDYALQVNEGGKGGGDQGLNMSDTKSGKNGIPD